MTHYDRKYGQLVRRLDSDKLLALGIEVLTAQYGDLDTVSSVESLVLVETKDASVWGLGDQKRLAVICSEGVGWTEDDKNGLVTFWVDFGHYGSHALAVKVHPRRILECLTDETVDLADFIRNYNDRLQSNYSLWASEIRDVPQFAQVASV
jgi:hypothetical protein